MKGPVLILGARGMLGSALLRLASQRTETVGAGRAEADITRPHELRELFMRVRPSVVFNCAAYTQVDRAEDEPEEALLVNAEGAGRVAEECRRAGALLVHISTDYVFDGNKRAPYTEEDPPSPVNQYGKSKLEGERRVQDSGAEHLIVRTSWLFGPGGKNFPDTILRLAQKEQELRVVDDQWGSPTYTVHLAEALLRLVEIGARGLFHVTGRGAATWFRLAQETLRAAGLDPRVVKPVATEKFPRPAVRPKWSVLDTSKFEALTGGKMPRWEKGVEDYLKYRLSGGSPPGPRAQ